MLLKELLVLRLMKIFAVREFSADEIRGRLNRDRRNRRKQVRLRLLRQLLRLDRLEWSIVQNLDLTNVDA